MNINLVCTAGTPGYGVYCSNNNSAEVTFQDCTMNGWEIGFYASFIGSNWSILGLYLIECTIENSVSHGAQLAGQTHMWGCYFLSNGGDGVNVPGGANGAIHISTCVASKNTAAGFHNANTFVGGMFSVINSVAYDNTGDGIELDSGTEQVINVINNILESNGGYGIDVKSPASAACPGVVSIQRNNGFYNNTSGPRNSGCPGGVGDVIYSGTAFVSASTGNFTLNSTAGAGALLQLAGWQSNLTN